MIALALLGLVVGWALLAVGLLLAVRHASSPRSPVVGVGIGLAAVLVGLAFPRVPAPSPSPPPSPSPSPPPVVPSPAPASPRDTDLVAEVARPGGPGAVHVALEGASDAPVEAELGFAKVLAGVRWAADDRRDLLVLQIAPTDGCDPRPGGLFPLDAVWVLEPLPLDVGLHTIEAGDWTGPIAKTWLYADGIGASHNLGLAGTLEVHARAPDRVSGTIDATLRTPDPPAGFPPPEPRVTGTMRGRFEAQIVDCSAWRGPYPL